MAQASAGAASRLVELGEGKRGEQLIATSALLLCDGDGGLEGFFGRRGVGEIALQQDFAAEPIEVRVSEMLPCLIRDRQPLVDLG